MPGPEQRRKAFRYYRRRPGLAWLVALALIPLLLGLIGYGTLDRSRMQAADQTGPDGALPTLSQPGPAGVPPELALAPLSITRHGNEITLDGNLPDAASSRTLLDEVIAAVGDDVNILDNLAVVPGVKTLDFSAAGPVFEAAAAIRDFGFTVNGDTITLTGTAATSHHADAFQNAVERAWRNVNLVSEMALERPPTSPGTPTPGRLFAPLSIIRDGNVVTVNGELPYAGTRTSLLSTVVGIFGQGTQVVDNVRIKVGVTAPDIASLTGLLKAAGAMRDFAFRIDGNTVTLAGTAASNGESDAVGTTAEKAWPDLNIVNEIGVRRPAPAPSAPEPSPGPGPGAGTGPGAGGSCVDLQAEITGMLRTPIGFTTDGYTLSPDSMPELTRVADTLKACPDARVTVNGYTDSTGGDALNGPLSSRRAQSVADFLVAHGVPSDRVSAEGFGSADPVASNDTADGRAQNRRVVIVVD